MRLNDDSNLNRSGNSIINITAISAICIIAVIFVVVFLINFNKDSKKSVDNQKPQVTQEPVSSYPDTSELINSDGLTPSDLDFWDKYPESTVAPVLDIPVEETPEPTEDPATDGKHFLVQMSNGEEEYVTINSYISRHSYDFTNMVKKAGIKKYYINNKIASKSGVILSEELGYIDFNDLKNYIQFAILSAGNRGNRSGKITEDTYYSDNLKRSRDNSIPIGILFESSAVSVDEAIEEASFIINSVEGIQVDYPVFFYMPGIKSSGSRTENLKAKELNEIIKAFCDKITEAGLIPVIMGDEEFLSMDVDMTEFEKNCIALYDFSDIPDYPYHYDLWLYSDEGKFSGISGNVPLILSFIDFTKE